MARGHDCPNALALPTFGHLLAVLLKIPGQVARTNAALPVAGHCVINKRRIGQVQVRHSGLELLQGPFFPKPGIAFLFLRDRGNVSVLVVVRRVHQNIIRQRKQLFSDALYKSVREKLFSLADDVLVYPAHDYKDRYVSSIAQEKKRNPRLGEERTLEEFKTTMANLNLPYPTFIDYAVPGNRQCGVCPCDLPENLEKYCQHMTESRQG